MKYCPEIIKEISDHIRLGRTQKDAAILSNISQETFHTWLKEHSEFSESIKKAQSEFKKQLEVRVQKASDTIWTAAAWLLERRFKEDYAAPARVILQGDRNNPVQTKLQIEIVHSNPDGSNIILNGENGQIKSIAPGNGSNGAENQGD